MFQFVTYRYQMGLFNIISLCQLPKHGGYAAFTSFNPKENQGLEIYATVKLKTLSIVMRKKVLSERLKIVRTMKTIKAQTNDLHKMFGVNVTDQRYKQNKYLK